ncbi:MAG: J domain-containing protein [Cyanophyceae cyanobacterium]
MTAPRPTPPPSPNPYALLGVKRTASAADIRRRYRDLSKRYHPDTTALPPAIATAKFRELNEAYAILSNPERRRQCDLALDPPVIEIKLNRPPAIAPPPPVQDSAYLDPTDRPLSGGELFALFSLGLSLVGCVGLVLLVAWLRGDPLALPPIP